RLLKSSATRKTRLNAPLLRGIARKLGSLYKDCAFGQGDCSLPNLLLTGGILLNRLLIVVGLLLVAAPSLWAQDSAPRFDPFIGRWLTSSTRGAIEISTSGGTISPMVNSLNPNRDTHE